MDCSFIWRHSPRTERRKCRSFRNAIIRFEWGCVPSGSSPVDRRMRNGIGKGSSARDRPHAPRAQPRTERHAAWEESQAETTPITAARSELHYGTQSADINSNWNIILRLSASSCESQRAKNFTRLLAEACAQCSLALGVNARCFAVNMPLQRITISDDGW